MINGYFTGEYNWDTFFISIPGAITGVIIFWIISLIVKKVKEIDQEKNNT